MNIATIARLHKIAGCRLVGQIGTDTTYYLGNQMCEIILTPHSEDKEWLARSAAKVTRRMFQQARAQRKLICNRTAFESSPYQLVPLAPRNPLLETTQHGSVTFHYGNGSEMTLTPPPKSRII